MRNETKHLQSRQDIIQIQKEILERTKKSIRKFIGYQSPKIRRYYHQYRQEFRTLSQFKSVDLDLILNAILEKKIVYCGDYHTLKQSQRTMLRLLREIHPQKNNLVLGMEAFQIKHQRHVDDFLEGLLSESEFLEKIDYLNTWGFDWHNYRALLYFAKENKLPVLALNSGETRQKKSLEKRDELAAKILGESMQKDPEALHFVHFGDLHVTENHLPKEVVRRTKLASEALIIFQNSETIYWELVNRGIEEHAEFIEMEAGKKYCIMNSTPWIKLQSFQNWIEIGEEVLCKNQLLIPYDEKEESLFDYQLHIDELITKIAKFVDIDRRSFNDFKVYTPEDIGFLIGLKKKIPRFSSHLKRILHNKCHFIASERIIYLAELDINHAAEISAEYLHFKCSGYDPSYASSQTEFYCRIFRKALGFFGSKLINPRRRVKDESYLTSISKREKPKGYRGFVSIDKRCAPWVIQHNQLLKKGELNSQDTATLATLVAKDTYFHFEISKKIGFILGDKIYRAFYSGALPKEDAQHLFHKDPAKHKTGPLDFFRNLWWEQLKYF
jgi:hypothetical protein